jgi:hypothetical protein
MIAVDRYREEMFEDQSSRHWVNERSYDFDINRSHNSTAIAYPLAEFELFHKSLLALPLVARYLIGTSYVILTEATKLQCQKSDCMNAHVGDYQLRSLSLSYYYDHQLCLYWRRSLLGPWLRGDSTC